MATPITGFNNADTGTQGEGVDGWDHVYGRYVFIADQSARLTANSDGQSVQLYSGWPQLNDVNDDASSLATNNGTDTIRLENFSWTIDSNSSGDQINTNVNSGWRNHGLHDANINWNDGDILIQGEGNGHRFGLGSGALSKEGSVTGTFNNIRIQANAARFIFQLRAFDSDVVSNITFDDFSYPDARCDINFPGGKLYENFATGAAQALTFDGTVTEAENGNFNGIAADQNNLGAYAPTALIAPNIRRFKVPGDLPENAPDFRFRHSIKATPMIIVDPTFTFINSIDLVTETPAVIETTAALNAYYSAFSSEDVANNRRNQAQANTFLWFGYRISLQPQTAGGNMLSGEYWVLDSAGLFSHREYRIPGITDNNSYTLDSLPTNESQGNTGFTSGAAIAGTGFEVDAAENDTVQLLSVTEFWENGNTIHQTSEQLEFNDLTDERSYIFHSFGYRPLVAILNPRNAIMRGVVRQTAEPVPWLKQDSANDFLDVTLNDAADVLYRYLNFDAKRSYVQPGSGGAVPIDWDDTVIDFDFNPGRIVQNSGLPTFNAPPEGSGQDAIWEIGRNHTPETAEFAAAHVNNEPVPLTIVTTFNGPFSEFDAEGQEIMVPNLNVLTITDLRTGLTDNAKAGGVLSGTLMMPAGTAIRLEGVDVSGLIIPDNADITVYGTDQNGVNYTDQSFNVQLGTGIGGIGVGNTARGLPRVEVITLPSHGVQQGWYYTTLTRAGSKVEETIEADSDPIRIESDEDVVFNLSTAGGAGSYRSVVWNDSDIFTVYYKYDSLIKVQPDDPDNIAYQETALRHIYGESLTRDLAPPPLIPSTQTEQAQAPENYSVDTHRFTDYTFAYSADNLDNPIGALAIRNYSGTGGSLATKSPESLGLALLIGNDPDFMRKFVEVSRGDSDNVIVPIFTVLGGNQVRWNPAAITLASDELLNEGTNQYRVQQSVAFWEYDPIAFPVPTDFSLARTGAAEVISFTPGEASLQQVQSAAQTGIDSSQTGMLIEETHNINHFLLSGDGGRFLGIKPRIEEFNPQTPYDV